MPSIDEHIKKATENEAFAKLLNASSQASINWKLIILFYTALHYVEAYLAKHLRMHLKLHTDRDNWVSKETNLKRIRLEYAHLKYFGFNARYEADQFKENDVNEALTDLAAVEAVLCPLVK